MPVIFDAKGNTLKVAVILFVMSFTGFSLVAYFTYDCVRAWRAVDYPWVCASLMAVIFALANATEVGWRQEFDAARTSYKIAISNFSYDLVYFQARHCGQESNLLDIQQGVCRGIPGVIKLAETLIFEIDSPSYELRETPELLWSFYPLHGDEVTKLVYTDTLWRLGFIMDRIWNASGAYQEAFKLAEERHHAWQAALVKVSVNYWYFLIAFFVGLRLSKTTAELLQAQAARTAAATRI
jgi:hypothetical protein